MHVMAIFVSSVCEGYPNSNSRLVPIDYVSFVRGRVRKHMTNCVSQPTFLLNLLTSYAIVR
jgi:hypothetical protein